MCWGGNGGENMVKSCKSRLFLIKQPAFVGPRWETRTPDILLPNLSGILFPLVYSGFRRFLICFTYSLTLLSPLFPGVPEPYVVIYVVKNASRPVSGEDSPVPDGKRFAFLCGVYCSSEGSVMQAVSARGGAEVELL